MDEGGGDVDVEITLADGMDRLPQSYLCAAFLAEQETADAEDGIDSSFLVQMLGYVADVEFLKGKHVAVQLKNITNIGLFMIIGLKKA